MQDKRKGAGMYDRRVQLKQPTKTQDPNNFNEVHTAMTIYLSGVPAAKVNNSGGDEKLDNHKETELVTVDWEMRYDWGVNIRASWVIVDLHDGQEYKVVGPVMEIGRRKAVRVKTELIQ